MIADEIAALLQKATEQPLILANQNGKRLKKPYMVLYVQRASRLPIHQTMSDDIGNVLISAHRDASCQIQCFGDGAYDELDAMAQRFKSPKMVDESASVNMAIEKIGQVQDIPVLRDSLNYEPRAILEFYVRYTLTTSENVGAIEHVGVGFSTTGGLIEHDECIFDASSP